MVGTGSARRKKTAATPPPRYRPVRRLSHVGCRITAGMLPTLRPLETSPAGMEERAVRSPGRSTARERLWIVSDERIPVTDLRQPVRLGVFPEPTADHLHRILELARVADTEGLDLIGVQDHPYQRRFVDTFTLLGWIAAVTRHVRVFPDVACLPLRPPAILAKQAATIDLLSGGRFELGLGAGGFWNAIEGMGGPRRSPREALTALEEAISILRRWWSEERGIHHGGDHYTLSGVHGGPRPAHRIEIWLGVYGPKAVELCGRMADGWLPSLPMTDLETLDQRQALLDRAARRAGRQPAEIRRMLNVSGKITDGPSRGFLHGPADQWVDQLAGLAIDHGFDTFILWPDDSDPLDQTARFARLADDLRDAVGRPAHPQPNSMP